MERESFDLGLMPKEIVGELDKYIIGQKKAKKLVSIAIRNRRRRAQLPDDIRDEVSPRNIIMIGPTGVGKTEIARRLAKLEKAPFIKVEATKFTEVGYVGRDVESMVRDLMRSAVTTVKQDMREEVEEPATKATEEALLELLLPSPSSRKSKSNNVIDAENAVIQPSQPSQSNRDHTLEILRKKLRNGELEDKKVEIIVSPQNGMPMVEILSGGNMDNFDMMGQINDMMRGGGKKKRKMTIAQAREIIMAEEVDKLIDEENAIEVARYRVENMGIIFIDEIDKVAKREGHGGGQDVSREGVQRDILPIVEGCAVSTRYGIVNTDHILFIAAGAFSLSKPSDLIPELQGRFPLRVELEDLNADDFEVILEQPKSSLLKQYKALLKTEGVELICEEGAIRRIAEIAEEVNRTTQNIGARRLYTVMELLLEDVFFAASELKGQSIKVTPDYVNERLKDIAEDSDMSRYIL